MKLYFSPGACCLSCHIILEETKTPFELVYVGKKAEAATKEAFLKVNPLGAVPALEFDDGRVLTQNMAILEYLADQHPQMDLIGKPGSWERAQTMRWLSFVAADLHKAFGLLFNLAGISSNPEAQKDIKAAAFKTLDKYCSLLEKHFQDHDYLAADRFSVADAYLFTVYQWTRAVNFPTEKYPNLNAYSERLAKRPSIVAAHEREKKYK